MELKINNQSELNHWMNERRRAGHDMAAVKGRAPDGATYSDGDPIMQPINIAWRDTTTGEVFQIDYA